MYMSFKIWLTYLKVCENVMKEIGFVSRERDAKRNNGWIGLHVLVAHLMVYLSCFRDCWPWLRRLSGQI